MPPVENDTGKNELKSRIQQLIDSNPVVVFSKSYCPFCLKVKDLFKELKVECSVVELDLIENGTNYQEMLLEMTGQKTVPNVFINKKHVGGCDKTMQAHKDGSLQQLLNKENEVYDYDLIIIGGGSGGLACSKKAAMLGKKVMVLDYVVPTPKGTSWGLGGTCVNVGCIPKKLMHQTAMLSTAMQDARKFGWEFDETGNGSEQRPRRSRRGDIAALCRGKSKTSVSISSCWYSTDRCCLTPVKHNWETMKTAVNNYIGSLNWGYRVALRDKNVNYVNAYAEFIEPHKIKATNKRGKETFYTAARFVLATGERPRYLGIPGDKEYCITSDDLFSLPYCPGKTLVVGASYVALECGGFLAGLGLDVTVMVRSILLRGFDQDMANRAGADMEEHGVKFLRKYVPVKIEELEAGSPGRLKVTAKSTETDEIIKGEYNTVLIAVGRDACTDKIGLDKAGVKVNPKNGKIPVNDEEQTNVPHIYAIGDILEGKWELTPVAIQAGKLLAQRLYGGSTTKCDYINVPTTVFTPLEYGSCGLSEEKAIELYGEDNLEIFHSLFWPLEFTVPGRDNNKCYAKIICNKLDSDRVIGFHYLGPNAGEVTQGYGAAMKCGVTKEQLDNTIGIHPTCAEVFTTLEVTKSSGGDITGAGC
ncbi:Thioredoxin reductase 3 [Channa argus]|uniref:thioredoxin-disulfide reductase (NADPH) n=1 Tax=Channa argus TaxID=215402 RepID=A0A6G1PHF2_CHAAH|nr:Thioredoxin reductase 3 [Channa argus]